uniref:transposase n=1 Tax=Candidatus Enterovibrio escicola TaxID=1927127 RepID=UPI0012382CEB|nr:transposase [Candidatus Enterovibrio escacola]
MKSKVMKRWELLMLRKRFIIKTVFDQLENISQIKHSQHRNSIRIMVNLLARHSSRIHFNQRNEY